MIAEQIKTATHMQRTEVPIVLPLLCVLAGLVAGGTILTAPWILAGPHLAVIANSSADPYIVTRTLWQLTFSSCGSAPCTYVGNALVFAGFTATFCYVAARLTKAKSYIALLALALAITTSPLTRYYFGDPTGGEALLSDIAILVLIAGITRVLYLPLLVQGLLIAFLLLQSPLNIITCAAYVAFAFHRNTKVRALSLIAVVLTAFGVSFYLHHGVGVLQTAKATNAQEATISVLGVLVLFVAPAVAYFIAKYTSGGMRAHAGRHSYPLAFALIVLIQGIIPTHVDPSPVWFTAEWCLLLFAVATLTSALRYLLLPAAAVIALQALLVQRPVDALPVSSIAARARDLGSILASNQPTCIASAELADDGLYFGKARLAAHLSSRGQIKIVRAAQQCASAATKTRLVFDNGTGFEDWGVGGTGLTAAMVAASTGKFLRIGTLDVVPRSRTPLPGGRGAFISTVGTPLGPANALTVVTGYVDHIACAWKGAGKKLSFAAGNPLQAMERTARSRFIVVARTDFNTKVLLVGDFLPGPAPVRWRFFKTALPPAHSCGDLYFTVAAPTGDATGTWTTFVEPTVN